MGCDIHCYLEFREGDSTYWQSFGQGLNPGRNYLMFGFLAGVRADVKPLYTPRGVPPDELGFWCFDDYTLYVTSEETDNVGWVSLKRATEWIKRGVSKIVRQTDDGKITHVTNPDHHTYSWLAVDEFENVLNHFSTHSDWEVGVEYKAILAALQVLKTAGDARIVFWFDN